MHHHLRRLKTAIERSADDLRIDYGPFCRRCGVNDFLIDAKERGWGEPFELAARSIDVLCEDDIPLYHRLVCLAVVDFLNEACGEPNDSDGMQRLKGLKSVLESNSRYDQAKIWCKTWYG